MTQKSDAQTNRMVELLTTAAKLPDQMQALVLAQSRENPSQPGKSA